MSFIERNTVKYPELPAREPGEDERIPVSVVATYNPNGAIRPDYVSVQDSRGMLHAYRVLERVYSKETNYAGMHQFRFGIRLDTGGLCDLKELVYDIELHRWWMNPKEL
ncbi:MAG: hypothetical protein ACI4CT_05140 [Lachnospiraceae bacterium]